MGACRITIKRLLDCRGGRMIGQTRVLENIKRIANGNFPNISSAGPRSGKLIYKVYII